MASADSMLLFMLLTYNDNGSVSDVSLMSQVISTGSLFFLCVVALH